MHWNSKFAILLIISIFGIIFSTLGVHLGILLLEDYSVVAIGIGFLPMAYWHFVLVMHREASPAQIDTIYFFGFLVTLVTLGCAATIALFPHEGTQRIQTISFQFAFGLLATGYGLIARVLLLNHRLSVSDADDGIDQFLNKISLVIARLEETVGVFDKLRADIVHEAQEGAATIAQVAVDTISERLSAPLDQLGRSISDLSALLPAKEFKKLNAQINETATGLVDVSAKLGPCSSELVVLTTNIKESRLAHEGYSKALVSAHISTKGFVAEADNLSQSIVALNTNIVQLATSGSKLAQDFSVINSQSVISVFGSVTKPLSAFVSELNGAAQEIAALKMSINLLSSSAQTASAKLVPDLMDSLTSVSAEMVKIENTLKNVQSLEVSLGSLDINYSQDLPNKISAISAELLSASTSLGEAMSRLAGSVRKAAEELSGE